MTCAFDLCQSAVGFSGRLMDGVEKSLGVYAAGTGCLHQSPAWAQNAKPKVGQLSIGR